MSSDERDSPEVPIECSECGTSVSVPLSSLEETLTRHNEQRHDGEQIARVDPAIAERIADLAADDLGLFDDEDAS